MQQTATIADSAMSSAARSSGIIPGDQIVVTLTGTRGDKTRFQVANTFDHLGRQVDNKGNLLNGRNLVLPNAGGQAQPTPAFPMADYVKAVNAKDHEAASRLTASYYDAVQAFRT